MTKQVWKILGFGAAGAAAASAVCVMVMLQPNDAPAPPQAVEHEGRRAPATVYVERRRSPLIDKLDFHFEHPNSPQTYRALNGLGVPDIEAWDYYAAGANLDDEGRALLQTLGLSPDASLWDHDCRPLYAVKVLRQRRAQLGAGHPYVARWSEVQRAVFLTCTSRDRATGRVLPAPLATRDARVRALQADDRAYQQASLAFYQGDKARALKAFRAIAASRSIHRGAARYMVLSDEAGEDYVEHRRAAPDLIRRIKAALSDPSLAPAHPLFQSLLGRQGYDVDDLPTRTAQVDSLLGVLILPKAQVESDAALRERYARALADISRLQQTSADNVAWWRGPGAANASPASRAMMQAASRDPLAAWLLIPPPTRRPKVWGGPDAAPGWTDLETYVRATAARLGGGWVHLDHALSRTGAPGWSRLDAEIIKAKTGDDAALAAVALDLPSAVRIAITRGGPDQRTAALQRLADFPWTSAQVYRTTVVEALRTLMLTGRIEEARQWRDRLNPGADPYRWHDDGAALLALLAEDQAHLDPTATPDTLTAPEMLDSLSVAALQALAADTRYETKVRALFARTAWTRSYALGRPIAADLDRLMRALNPEVTKSWVSKVGDAARPDNPRVLFDVLGSPAMNVRIHERSRLYSWYSVSEGDLTSIDYYNHSDNDWWCARNAAIATRDEGRLLRRLFQQPSESWTESHRPVTRLPDLDRLRQTSLLLRSRDEAELAALTKIEAAPRRLSLAAIAWTRRANPLDHRDRQSEALARAVVTTRYGCPDQGGHAAYSRAAFERLHTHYRFSPAARATPYWFDRPLVRREDAMADG